MNTQANALGEFLLGQSAPLSGALARTTHQFNSGAQAWLKYVNDGGGVNGRPFRMLSLDDGGWSEQGEVNAKLLISGHSVHALFGFMGASAGLPCALVADRERVPFVAPVTGNNALRTAALSTSFLMRPSFHDEVFQIVRHGSTMGYKSIDLIFDYNAQGFEIRSGFEDACEQAGLKSCRAVSMARLGDDVSQAVGRLRSLWSQAVILACNHDVSGAFIRSARASGFGGIFYALTTVDPSRLIESIKGLSIGVHFVQAVPYPWAKSKRVSADFLDFSQRHVIDPDFASFEGYLAARWVTHMTRRASQQSSLLDAFTNSSALDLGGFHLNMIPGQRSASRFMELATINRDLRFVR
jgi:branched-chain amino acid transport system substrate-binding protein